MSKEQWIVVDEAPNHFHAEIIRGLLEAQEIPAMLFEEAVGRVMPFTVGSTAWVEIMVPAQDEQRARQVLKAYYENASTNGENFDDPENTRAER
ncbi:MAG: DUF2007 domain-containing protein [Anaerolineales bacterium]|nr:DUF2007 domain-containing protein [Anaerolineales bacterium]